MRLKNGGDVYTLFKEDAYRLAMSAYSGPRPVLEVGMKKAIFTTINPAQSIQCMFLVIRKRRAHQVISSWAIAMKPGAQGSTAAHFAEVETSLPIRPYHAQSANSVSWAIAG